MTKIVVETTGNFMLQDITNGAAIEAEGSTEVEKTGFVEAQIELGRLKEVGGTADHAADRYDDKEEAPEPDPKPVQHASSAKTTDAKPVGAESRNKVK